jgi:hypothetical protein
MCIASVAASAPLASGASSFLINTGLQAGVHDASPVAKAVSTAFLILPSQAMALNEFPKLIGERAQPDDVPLSGNVGTNLCDVGF